MNEETLARWGLSHQIILISLHFVKYSSKGPASYVSSLYCLICLRLIPVAERSKAFVYGCSVAGTEGSNPIEGMEFTLSCDCCVLSGRGLCGGPFPRPEESYQVRVSPCDQIP